MAERDGLAGAIRKLIGLQRSVGSLATLGSLQSLGIYFTKVGSVLQSWACDNLLIGGSAVIGNFHKANRIQGGYAVGQKTGSEFDYRPPTLTLSDLP